MLAALLVLAAATPEERAIAWLEREVPAWRRDNGCFSCHNDGDGARALYRVRRAGTLAPTTAWLAQPGQWDHNNGNPAVSDKRLARIQFASALSAAIDAGAIKDKSLLVDAARAIAREQDPDGSWAVEDLANLGSPATYGRILATVMAWQVLRTTGLDEPRARAERWLASLPPRTTLDASALALAELPGHAAAILKAQTSDGGFGPHPGDPPEVFDTALAMLALGKAHPQAVVRARAWLIRQQQPDGSWPETTRPSGSQSYAQRVSTTAWALMALAAVRP